MCCFSRPVKFVGATRIFARAGEGDRQLLAYAMSVEIDTDLSMVLPLPVPPSPGDDAVRFVDLAGCASLFDDLEAAFPPDYAAMPAARKGGPSRSAPEKPKLVVHDVGMFEASFVPTRADFARLEPRFRMPEAVWSQLPEYADWGFAVFRLKPKKQGFFRPTATRERIHPMAFSFPRRDPGALFFPTLHVHDGGSVPPRASFDHMLYCQADGVLEATLDWTRSTAPLGESLRGASTRGLVDLAALGLRQSIVGDMPNRDVTLAAPRGVSVADLSGGGEEYSYRARAAHAYALEPWDDMRRAWQRTAREGLPALCRGLRDGLAALVAARRASWGLTKLSDGLAPHFVNGNQLWTGHDYMTGSVANDVGRPGRVAMKIFTPSVEPQDVTLAFARLPDQATLDAIRAELGALVDRASAR